MTATDTPTLELVLTLARRLPAADQVRLVAQLSSAIAAAPIETTGAQTRVDDPRAVLAQLREDFRVQGSVVPSMADDLTASRR